MTGTVPAGASVPLPASAPAPGPRPPKPPSMIVMGPSGSGKTDSLATLVEAGLETFVIITEPNGLDTLLDSMKRRGLPIDRLHWTTITPAAPGWKSMEAMMTKVTQLNYSDLTELKSGIDKSNTTQLLTVLRTLVDFRCERTGVSFGDVTRWGPDRALAVDSLSGLNIMALDMTIGMKPTAHQGEWGVAMNLEEKLILNLTSQLQCFFVLTAHIDKEPNEITGATNITVSALGRKLAPKLGKFFGDIVRAHRQSGTVPFHWSNDDPNTDLKNRALPISSNLPPSFVEVWKRHQERLRTAQGQGSKP